MIPFILIAIILGGFLFDYCNSRVILSISCLVLAAAVVALPYGHAVYPGVLIINICLLSAVKML